jgi:hypothetical protein
MEGLVPPPVVDGRFQLEDKSNNAEGPNSNVKRPALKAGGCRVEGFVRVKKVQSLRCYFLYLNNQLFPIFYVFYLVKVPDLVPEVPSPMFLETETSKKNRVHEDLLPYQEGGVGRK